MRVATIPLQATTVQGIQRAQYLLAQSQAQMASSKKAPDMASLGTEAVRTLSARTLLAKQEAQGQNATRLGTTLSLYETSITSLEDGSMAFSTRLMTAIGTGDSTGLTDEIEAAFDQFRSLLNVTEGGLPLFGAGNAKFPFTAQSLADLSSAPIADFFIDGNVVASARVADGLDVNYGISASQLGRALAEVYRDLGALGPFGDHLTAAQKTGLVTIKNQIDTAISEVRGLNAANGRRLAQMDTLAKRAEERALVLRDVIGRNEDADLAQVAMELTMHKTMLEASYSVFSQINQLSLLRYLQ